MDPRNARNARNARNSRTNGRRKSDEADDLQETSWTAQLDLVNDGFTAIFVLEMILKIAAFGMKNYWRDSWNKFDVVVVVASLTMVAVDGFMGFTVRSTKKARNFCIIIIPASISLALGQCD